MSKLMKIYNLVESLDLNGKPFQFTYKNRETFKTFIGGIITLVSIIIIFIYVVILTIAMINGQQTITLEFEKCSMGRFKNENETFEEIGLDNVGWECIKNFNYTLIGQENSNYRQYLRLRVYSCVNETTEFYDSSQNVTCASQEEITNFFKLAIIQLATLNQFFDEGTYSEQPVKNEISVDLYNIDVSLSSANYLHVIKKFIDTRDSWFSSFLDRKQFDIYEVQSSRQVTGSIKPGAYDMLTIYFVCGNQERNTARFRYTMTDLLSQAGGFSTIVMSLLLQMLEKEQKSCKLLNIQKIARNTQERV
eukprot:403362366